MRLKRFNVQKESKRLQNYHNKSSNIKKRTIILSAFILVGSIMLLTYASFSSSIKVDVMHSKVGNLIQDDYEIKAYINNTLSNDVPEKEDGYTVDHVNCTNDAVGTWDDVKWGILITEAEEPTVCSVYFTSFPGPELYQGMIPVKYDNNGHTIVADPSDWYDYEDHEWANAVLVGNSNEYFDNNGNLITSKIGQTIDNDILQYYVWIPRYRYKLFNAVAGEVSEEQMINIEFENKSETKSDGNDNGEWLTHPAFTFGNTELNGFWVGKFEMTGSISDNNNPTSLTILPNNDSLANLVLSNMFNSLRNMDINYASAYGLDTNQIDTHIFRNMEWGAVAYLTNSEYGRYNSNGTCVSSGCEVWMNINRNNDKTTTGCAGNAVNGNASTTCNTWDTTNGMHASSTDNQYGLYDLNGGNWEYVMGNYSNSTTESYTPGSSQIANAPNSRYIDLYFNTINTNSNYQMGKLGDATREVMKVSDLTNNNCGWYSDFSVYPSGTSVYFRRGGDYHNATGAGIFSFYKNGGTNDNTTSYRAILSAQDGNYNGNGLS